MAMPSESKAIDPPRDEALAARTALGSERTDPPPCDEALAAPIATPSGPATLAQDQTSGILNSTAHRAEPVAHDRHGTAAESGRAPRGTNLTRVMHRSLHARSAHASRNPVLSNGVRPFIMQHAAFLCGKPGPAAARLMDRKA